MHKHKNVTVLSLSLAFGAHAADIYKINNTTSLNTRTSWSTTSGSQTPNPGALGTDNWYFNEVTMRGSKTVLLGANRTIGGMALDYVTSNTANNLVISSGNTLTINGGTLGGNGVAGSAYTQTGILLNRATGGTLTINASVALGAAQSWVSNRSSGGFTVAGAVNLGSYALTTGITAGTTTISGVISGTGSLTKTGSGTLVLSGANTYSGGTSMTGGILQLGANDALPGSASVSSGATLDINGFYTNTALTIAGTGASGQGALINSSGTLPSVTQDQILDILLSDDASLGGSGSFSMVDIWRFLIWTFYLETTLDLDGHTLTKVGSGTFYLANTTITAGTVHISAGTLSQHSGSDGSAAAFTLDNASGATLALNGHNLSVGSLAGGGAAGGTVALGSDTLTVGALNSDTTYAGVISGASGRLTKTGSGTLTLTGASTYSGATTVSAGMLRVNGSVASATSVASGATLSGSGTIGNNVAVASGGTLSPGDGVGTLTVNGTLSLPASSTNAVQVASSAADRTSVSGTATLGGVLSLDWTSPTQDSYVLLTADEIIGTFSNYTDDQEVATVNGRTYFIHYVTNPDSGDDYVVLNVNPTLATITAVRAYSQGGHRWLEWEVALELDTKGYDLERKEDGEWVRITGSLVPAQAPGEGVKIYRQMDDGVQDGETHTWRIIEEEFSGTRTASRGYRLTVNGAEESYDDWASGITWQEADGGRDGDPDEDGLTNWEEYLAGTDPLDPNSLLRVTSITPMPTGFHLTWTSEDGRWYVVQMATELDGVFYPVPVEGAEDGMLPVEATPPENAVVVKINPSTVSCAFFRVVVKPQDWPEETTEE
ncbi:MAG: autotransporter-associated beta strand repeat-containing protein [Kiritimatiellae bacterium]|nr:autotransporter-associated beta strand repeat-containing protein [Kiritimatiellia bacterium]